MNGKINLFLLISLILFTCLSINVNPDNESKVVYEFGSLKPNSTSLEVSSAVQDSDCVSLITRLSYDDFVIRDKPDDLSTSDEIDEYKNMVKTISKKYHYTRNKQLLNSIKITDYKDVYVSTYSPYIEYLYDKSTFIENKDEILGVLSNCTDINKVSVKSNAVLKNNISDAIADSNGTEYLSTNQYRGEGIKVGILESKRINVDHSNLDGVEKYVYDNPWTIDTSSDHATAMASIIAHQSVGIAPDVSIYSASVMFGLSDEFDWFVENNVDVINMSFGEEVPDGVYSSRSAMSDYISLTYGISMIASAGNSGEQDAYVGNPGLGYNVMGIGNYTGSSLSLSSSYNEVTGPEKPNLITRGSAVLVPNFGCPNGTSTSSAVMTGFVACLMSQYPTLTLYPERVYALVMANSFSIFGFNQTEPNGMNGATGAGLFNLQSASNSYSKVQTYTNTNATYTTERLVTTFSAYYSVGKTINVACFWPAYATGDEDETVFTSYRMDLCNTVGQVVESVVCDKSNYMIIQNYDVLITGTYTVKVYQTGILKNTSGDKIAVGFGSQFTA